MAKSITTEEVKKIAALANIDITDTEAVKYAKQIGEILAYVEKLNEIDTEGLEFKSQVDLKNVFREDESRTEEIAKDITRNRKVKNGAIVISGVLKTDE